MGRGPSNFISAHKTVTSLYPRHRPTRAFSGCRSQHQCAEPARTRKSITESTLSDAAMGWNDHPYEGRGPAPVPSWCTGDAVTGRWSLVVGRWSLVAGCWSPAASRAMAEEPAAEVWPLSLVVYGRTPKKAPSLRAAAPVLQPRGWKRWAQV